MPRFLAFCEECLKRSEGPVLGEVEATPGGVALKAHETIWEGHVHDRGHTLQIVDYEAHVVDHEIVPDEKKRPKLKPFLFKKK